MQTVVKHIFFQTFFENLEGDDTRTQSESTNQANRKKVKRSEKYPLKKKQTT